MSERTGAITFQGNPLALLGREVKVGDEAPDFEVLGNDLSPVRLSDFKGKVTVLCSVPSLDTDVCDTEARRFNVEATRLAADVEILAVSMDLPFAQGRWCASALADRVKTVSDHREASFGLAYGVLIKELRLLSRAVFVVGKTGKIEYIELVKEITNEPNYGAALEAVSKASDS